MTLSEKSLTEFKHLLVLDLTKIGTAYQMINSFVDDEAVHVFEISPIGTNAVFILGANDLITLQLVQQQAVSFFKSDILNIRLIDDVHPTVLLAYLSQSSVALNKHIAVIEETSFALAFHAAQTAAKLGVGLVDFRAVRTGVPNLMITLTSDSIEKLAKAGELSSLSKFTMINDVQKPLRAYFEVLD